MKATYELAVKWFDALQNGRTDELYTYMDDNILWENCNVIPGYNDIIPWLGTYHGKYEVKKTFEVHDEMSQALNFDLGEFCVDGEVVIVHAYETHKLTKNGEIYHADVLFRMRREGEKITEWKAYWDTAEAISAFKKK